MTHGGDYDYIIRAIQYLDMRHHIRFFITSKDFDVLYRWWEKNIPEALLHESLDRVVERCRRRQRPPGGFSAFSYEVRKNFLSFLQLGVGGRRQENADPHADLAQFLTHLPPGLEFARDDIALLFEKRRLGEAADPGLLEEKLLDRFRDDDELNAKAAWFLNNLAPALRRPDIERRYRLNYLWGKFGIPILD
jgi:hypothetical protein